MFTFSIHVDCHKHHITVFNFISSYFLYMIFLNNIQILKNLEYEEQRKGGK